MNVSQTASVADQDLLIVRTFDAPASLIFRLWSEPAHFRRWIGPATFECTDAQIDFRVGGAYHATIRAPGSGPGSGDSHFSGTYRAIEPDRRIVFTFAWSGGPSAGIETIVTVLLEDRGGRTVQTFHQAPFLDAERRDSHRGGWSSTFDCLEAYAAREQEHAP